MELSHQKKLVNHIFRLLKVTEIVIPIGRTNKGNLGIKFQSNQEDYEIYLDAVPLSTKDFLQDENNIELKKMLDKYLFEQEKIPHIEAFQERTEPISLVALDAALISVVASEDEDIDKATQVDTLMTNLVAEAQAPKKRGRPFGSKKAK